MKLNEARAAGILKSPSQPRWLSNGDITHIPLAQHGKPREMGMHDLVVCRVFELAAELGGMAIATDAARNASQKYRCGVLTPIVLTGDELEVKVIFELADIVMNIARKAQAAGFPTLPAFYETGGLGAVD